LSGNVCSVGGNLSGSGSSVGGNLSGNGCSVGGNLSGSGSSVGGNLSGSEGRSSVYGSASCHGCCTKGSSFNRFMSRFRYFW